MLHGQPVGFATAELPGLAGPGQIKSTWADFVVEEVPAYVPCGQGDHLFVWIEKAGTPAEALIGHIARSLHIDRRDIGCAGLKDAQAVTRQYVSVPAGCADRLAALDTERIRVLHATRHSNKLKTGHLRGNRFAIRVPQQSAEDATRAQAVAQRLDHVGVPNFYGPQRFGRGGSTLTTGLSLLRPATPGAAGHAPSRMLRRLALSCVQSALFNHVLSARLADGLLHRVLLGDVCLVRASGGPFVSDDAARETARLAAKEVVTAGPMFGPKMRAAGGQAAAREDAALQDAGLSREAFTGFGKLLQGTRRANLVWPEDLVVTYGDDAILHLKFGLPPGSYATVVLREFWRTAGVPAAVRRPLTPSADAGGPP